MTVRGYRELLDASANGALIEALSTYQAAPKRNTLATATDNNGRLTVVVLTPEEIPGWCNFFDKLCYILCYTFGLDFGWGRFSNSNIAKALNQYDWSTCAQKNEFSSEYMAYYVVSKIAAKESPAGYNKYAKAGQAPAKDSTLCDNVSYSKEATVTVRGQFVEMKTKISLRYHPNLNLDAHLRENCLELWSQSVYSYSQGPYSSPLVSRLPFALKVIDSDSENLTIEPQFHNTNDFSLAYLSSIDKGTNRS